MRALAAVLFLLGCGEATSEHDHDLPPGTVRYALDWTLGDAELVASGGWEVTNDLGQTIHVTEGWLTSYSAQLVPCPETSVAQVLLKVVGIGTAWAGHSGEEDPSVTTVSMVQDLADPQPVAWDEVTYAPESERYCKVHYLAARAEREAVGLPGDAMVGLTLQLAGTVRRDGEAPEPFTSSTDLATGRLSALSAELDPAAEGATVTITRDLGLLLAGVDLFGEAIDQQTQLVLNLPGATTIEVTPSR